MSTPAELIDGYAYVASGGTVAENSIVIPLTSLSIDATVANASTGDGRKVVAAIMKNIATKFAALGTKPSKLTVAAQSNTQTGKHTDTYTVAVVRSIMIGDVAAE